MLDADARLLPVLDVTVETPSTGAEICNQQVNYLAAWFSLTGCVSLIIAWTVVGSLYVISGYASSYSFCPDMISENCFMVVS